MVTLTFLFSILLVHEPQRLQGWRLAAATGVAIGFGVILQQFAMPVPGGLAFGFVPVPAAMMGFYRGPWWGLAVGLPLGIYWSLQSGVWAGGLPATMLAGVAIGLLRTTDRDALYHPFPRLWWRALLGFTISGVPLAMAHWGLHVQLRGYLVLIVLLETLAFLVCAQVLGERLRMLLALREATHMAYTDPLTGLPNLRSFEQAVQRHPDSVPGCLLLLDLDHFKRINDSYGHPAGDEVLRSVAAVIQGQVRAGDIVCRYGGEEFAVLLRECSLAQAAQVAERIREEVAAHSPAVPGGQAVSLTISGGLIRLEPDAGLKYLFASADRLLYCSKEGGRNRISTRCEAM
jgi:diguanylate cyclase